MILISGAGPVGSHAAALLTKRGFDVTVAEEHPVVGRPIQCTGLLSKAIDPILRPDPDCIVNRISMARIISGDNRLDVKIKPNYIVDRSLFDRSLTEAAEAEGAEILLSTRFEHRLEGKAMLRQGDKRIMRAAEIVVGADGPNSAVARDSGIFGKRTFFTGMQAVVKMKAEDLIEFHPDVGCYAWIVPEDDRHARVGVVDYHNPSTLFWDFLKQKGIRKSSIIGWQSGMIPRHDPNLQTETDDIFLVGDAATQVKATTGGGIVPGLRAAACLADSVAGGKSYESLWKKDIGKELWLHLKARQAMDRFTDNDWDDLVSKCSRDRLRKLFYEEERDNLSKLAMKMVASDPRLLKFAVKAMF